MKKISLYISLLTLTCSVDVNAMGLGEMSVSSYLDQPFNAEIELIDVGDTPLSGIKANIATPEEYERMGLEHSYAVGMLSFFIEKNELGHPVVKIRSVARITEPFMQILLDLAWAKGQVYRSYTILLDPPRYKINLAQKQLNNLVKREFKTDVTPHFAKHKKHQTVSHEENNQQDMVEQRTKSYGPTIANETIWQIAQRFKSDSLSLQQIILAILGTNPEAFVEGNLNGLKVGSVLQIPSDYMTSQVPLGLAKAEVLAQDKAWQSRQAIEHVLLPPYVDAHPASNKKYRMIKGAGSIESIVPKIPHLPYDESLRPNESRLIPLSSSLLKVNEDITPTSGTAIPKITGTPPVKAMAMAAAAIDSVREANTMLIEQLRVLQKDNKRLQQQLIQRNQEMQQLRKRMNQIVLRKGLAGQVSQEMYGEENSSILPWLLLFILLGLSGGVAYWWFWIRLREDGPTEELKEHVNEEHFDLEKMPMEPIVHEETNSELQHPIQQYDAPRISSDSIIEEQQSKIMSDEPIIEEEQHQVEIISDEPVKDEETSEVAIVSEAPEKEEDSHEIEMVLDDSVKEEESHEIEMISEEPSKEEDSHEIEMVLDEPLEEKSHEVEMVSEKPRTEKTSKAKKKKENSVEKKPKTTKKKRSSTKSTEENTIEFEFEPIAAEDASKKIEETPELNLPEDEHNIEFTIEKEEDHSEASEEQNTDTPTKSHVALETLLDLAKTYIGMDDFDAAKQSLNEVIEYGSKEQKKAAKLLLDEIKNKT